MMLHQDGSRHAWLAGQPPLDLIVTMDDATSEIYAGSLVEEEGTLSTFQACLEVLGAHGLPCQFYTDRASHYFVTREAGGKVDKERFTQVGRVLARLGIEHIAAYSPEARGRSERMFGTLQDRLPKELALAGIRDIETANRWIKELYLPAHNRRFAKPPALPESAFLAVDQNVLTETLCLEEERIVGRDNRVAYEGRRLQIAASPARPHYVKARVKVRGYPDGTLALFHGPRCPRRPDRFQPGPVLAAVKAWPCDVGGRGRGGATASLDGGCARSRRRTAGRDGETGLRAEQRNWTGRGSAPTLIPRDGCPQGPPLTPRIVRKPQSGQLMSYRNRTSSKATDSLSCFAELKRRNHTSTLFRGLTGTMKRPLP
jgi:hypothetical protein